MVSIVLVKCFLFFFNKILIYGTKILLVYIKFNHTIVEREREREREYLGDKKTNMQDNQ